MKSILLAALISYSNPLPDSFFDKPWVEMRLGKCEKGYVTCCNLPYRGWSDDFEACDRAWEKFEKEWDLPEDWHKNWEF